MPYHFTETHLELQAAIRRMVEKEVRPIAADIDETDRFPEHLVSVFGDMGLLQIWVPEKYGGPGGDLTSVCLAREEISKVSEACALLAGQNSIALILPLLHFGTEEQRQRWLPLSAKGRTLTAVAITEPNSGSDVASMRTTARRDGASWVINGSKCYITWGNLAHYVLVFARTSGEKGFGGLSCFLVDTKTKGFRVGKNERKMGLNGVPDIRPRIRGHARSRRLHDRRGGARLHRRHAHPRHEPAHSRCRKCRPRAGCTRCRDQVRQGAKAIR